MKYLPHTVTSLAIKFNYNIQCLDLRQVISSQQCAGVFLLLFIKYKMNPGRFYPSAHAGDLWGTQPESAQHRRRRLKKQPGLPAQGGLWLEGLTVAAGRHVDIRLPGRTWRDRNSSSLLIIEDEAGRWWFREDLWICVTVGVKQTACFDLLSSLVYDCFTVRFISEVRLWVHITVCLLMLGGSSVLHSPCLLYLHTADSVIIRWRWRLGWFHCCWMYFRGWVPLFLSVCLCFWEIQYK